MSTVYELQKKIVELESIRQMEQKIETEARRRVQEADVIAYREQQKEIFEEAVARRMQEIRDTTVLLVPNPHTIRVDFAFRKY